VNSTLALVGKAPVGKDRAALEAIKMDVDALKGSLAQIQTAIDKEDYPAAQSQAKAIHEKSQTVSAEIQSALAKVGKRKSSASKK
jgi:HPt (histidine-containing phosphotransfer) domain-containing protein